MVPQRRAPFLNRHPFDTLDLGDEVRDARTNETSEEGAPGRLDRLRRPGRIDVPERELDPPSVATALRVLGADRSAEAHLAIPSEPCSSAKRATQRAPFPQYSAGLPSELK
jgi:hypothetical protein